MGKFYFTLRQRRNISQFTRELFHRERQRTISLKRDDNNALEFFEGEREIEDNIDAIYRWFDLTELCNVPLKPDCSREILNNISPGIQHYINREN